MKASRAILGAVAIMLAIAAALFWRQAPAPVVPVKVVETVPPGIVVSESSVSAPALSGSGNGFTGENQLGGYADASQTPSNDLALMGRMISGFLTLNKQATARPLSANEEWSAALRGKRPGTEAWLSGRPPVFDSNLRLIDRWGTPLHFHALGGKRWEIRSAGPDRKLWTADDLLETFSG